MISARFRDGDSEMIESRLEASPSNIRINIRHDEESMRHRVSGANPHQRENHRVVRNDLELRNRSVSHSYFETEREEDLYDN